MKASPHEPRAPGRPTSARTGDVDATELEVTTLRTWLEGIAALGENIDGWTPDESESA